MEEIRGKVFRKTIVELDGKVFVECVFEECLLVYRGEPCEWENSRFQDCKLALEGKAHYTLQILPLRDPFSR
jgi:hypothetical protein